MLKKLIIMCEYILNFFYLPVFSIQYLIRPLVKYGLLFYIILFIYYLFYYIYVLSKSVINYKNLFYKSTRKGSSFMGLFTVPNFIDMGYYLLIGICYFIAVLLLIPIICIVFIPIYPILSMDWDSDSVGINDPKFLIALFVFILLTALSIYLFFFNS